MIRYLLLLSLLPSLALGQVLSRPGGAVSASGTSSVPITAPGVTSTSTVQTKGLVSTALTAPTNATFTAGAGTLTTATYYYRVTALNAAGETVPSTETSLSVTGPAGVNVNWGAVTGATSYKVYGRSTGAELLVATVTAPTTTWLDSGAVTPSGAMPITGTSASISIPTNSRLDLGSGTNDYWYSDGANIYTLATVGASNVYSTASSGAVALYGVNGAKFCPGATTACITSDGTTLTAPPISIGASTALAATYVGTGSVFASTTIAGSTNASTHIGSRENDDASAVAVAVYPGTSLTTEGASIMTFAPDTGNTVTAKITKAGMLQMGIGNTAAPPTCDTTQRGKVWFRGGAGGVTDTLSVCLKAAADTYSWVTITTGG